MKEWLYRQKRKIQKKANAIQYKYVNNRYTIAFRQRTGSPLYEKNASEEAFFLVHNTFRYWMADPFLFKYGNDNYIFAEMFDKKESKGVIGYAKLKENKCGKFRVCLIEDHHLSYPCVFEREGNIYMIPETKENNTVTIYKAIDFPNKWKRVQTLCQQPCVDTTPFRYNNENYFFTTIANEYSTDDNLFLIYEKTGQIKELLKNNLCLRSAGNVIWDKSQMIRPSQDDTVYGDAVIFNRVTKFENKDYEEIPYRKVLPPEKNAGSNEISVRIINNTKNIKFDGLHTYNVNEDYEVIDLRYPRLKKRK